ncbi:uncharacterized protein BDFB_005572, partial [Asbolus verrucosus]
MDLQTAINNSKDTASLEEEKREYVRQAEEEMQKLDTSNITSPSPEKPNEEKSFTFTRSKSPIDIFEIEQELLPGKKKFEITFQDMLKSSKDSLEIIYHNPIYELPIPTNPRYQKYSIQERAKLLYDYHSKISELQSRLAKKSLHRAPYSKPILPSNKCKTSLVKNSQDEEETIEEPSSQMSPQEFYVSRAGRQVKRKIYTEDTEVDSDPDFTSVKKNKSNHSESNTKITIDTPYVPEENHNVEKSASKVVKAKKDTPRRALPLSTKKMGRAEVLFENLINEGAKMKRKQKEMDSFEKTLPNLDESEEDKLLMDDDSLVKESPAEANEENFIRKRVVPPLPGRKPIRSKKQITQEDFDKIDIVPATPPGSPVLKQYTNLNRSLDITKSASKAAKSKENLLSDETSLTKLEKRDCPICGRKFLQSEIEHHASTCGIEDEIEEFPENSSEQLERITCHLCDKVFILNTNYEVHVKQCIAKTITD